VILPAPAFKPAWWCRGAHAQTIAGGLLRPKPRPVLNRKRFETPDGDFPDLNFLTGKPAGGKADLPQVVIVHGLEGSSGSPYIERLFVEIERHGAN